MAKVSKLKAALERHQGKDHVHAKQKKISRRLPKLLRAIDAEDSDEAPELVDTGAKELIDNEAEDTEEEKSEEEEEEEEEEEDENEEEEDENEEDEEEDEEDISLSDIEDEDLEVPDVIPHQKLTINNHSALTQALSTIALPANLLFSEHQSITTSAPVEIKDINDDLNRELAFYAQALDAAKIGREKLLKEGLPFSRPVDYFAEMLKDDEHMGKIKQKLLDQAVSKKKAQEARKQRDLKKFGKQVQTAKLQEREKAKKETLEKIQILKRKRQGAETELENEEDMFDIALDEETKDDRRNRDSRGKPNFKRQKKDQKYGHGGKKRYSKSGDAKSSGDLSGFSNKKNKASFAGVKKRKAPQRPGKSKRAAKR
ncbi:rRNA-processing protein EBP2 [Rhizina undulata]